MTKSKWLRIALNGVLLAAFLWLPWWMAVIIVLILVFRFQAYEVIIWGVLGDALYGAPLPILGEFPIFFTLLFMLLFLAGTFSKQFLVFY